MSTVALNVARLSSPTPPSEIMACSGVPSPSRSATNTSLPVPRTKMTRPATVTVKHIGRDGKEHVIEADGLLATCLQHEIDHLDGVLFIDHISRLKREMVIKRFTKAAKAKAV